MLKIVTPDSFDFDGPITAEVPFSRRGLIGEDRNAFLKRASYIFADALDAGLLRPGEIPIHLFALGTTEKIGPNRNGDGFKKRACERYHDTFVKFGRWYRDHCFPAGTPIVMADRTRRAIELVQEGDLVATAEGPKRVLRTMCRPYDGPGVRLQMSGLHEPLIGTWEHPVYTLQREQIHCRHRYNCLTASQHHAVCAELRDLAKAIEPRYAEINSVLVGDYLLLPKPQHGDLAVREEFAELVGWVAAEGYLGARGAIQFTFSAENTADVAAVVACLRANKLHVSETPRPQYGTVALSACSAAMSADLAEYLAGTFAEKRLLSPVLQWNAESLLRLLGAYIDGDGHVAGRAVANGAHHGQLRIRSSSPAMRHMLADICRSLDVPVTTQNDKSSQEMVSPTNGQTYLSDESGTVTVASEYSPLVCRYSRKLQQRERVKSASERRWNDMFLLRVSDRDDLRLSESVYNLEVESPNHYVAAEAIVHNCNRNPEKSYGRVIKSAFNDPMGRVELLVGLNGTEEAARRNGGLVADKEMEKLAAHQDIPTSMSCVIDPTTPLLTAQGYKPIAAVEVGELTHTHLGRWRRIKQLNRRRYTGEAVKIEVVGLARTLFLTADHPLYAQHLAHIMAEAPSRDRRGTQWRKLLARGEDAFQWLHAGCLEVSDSLDCRPIESIPGHNGLSVAEARDAGEAMRGTNWLLAYHHQIPLGLFNSSREAKLAFLGAWFDATGFVHTTRAGWKSVNHTLLLVGRDLLLSLGIPASIRELPRSRSFGQNPVGTAERPQCRYELTLALQFTQEMIPYSTDADLYVPRRARTTNKNSCLHPIGNSYHMRIRSIEKVYVEDVQTWNVEVEDDESYSLVGVTSHNCFVPFDVCSSCQNKAASRRDYCTDATCRHGGLARNIGKVAADGHHLHADNPDPRFFDISHVVKNADRIAFVLGELSKAAGLVAPRGGAWMAEQLELAAPVDVLLADAPRDMVGPLKLAQEMAWLEREVHARTESPWNHGLPAVLREKVAEFPALQSPQQFSFAMKALALEKVALPLRDFLSLVLGDTKRADEVEPVVRGYLPGVFQQLATSYDLERNLRQNPYQPARGLPSVALRKWAATLAPELSLDYARVEKRATLLSLRGLHPPRLTRTTTKVAGDCAGAEQLAKHYGLYELGFLQAVQETSPSDFPVVSALLVRQNCVA